MILLSVIVAALTAGMAATHVASPEAIPQYVIWSGVVMALLTWRAAGIITYLRMFVAGYAVAFAAFALGFIVFGNGGLPEWTPGWMQTLQPKPFLALAFTVFAGAVMVMARLPLIHETIGLSEHYFSSRDPSRLRYLPVLPLSEGAIGRAFLLVIILINFVQTYLLILFNTWQGALFDSFQNMDEAAFWLLVTTFLFLAGQWVVFSVVEYLLGQYMLIRWRRHMSREYVADWLEDERHYRIQFVGEIADNPDQRISEDIRTYVTNTYSISSSLFSTFLSLAAFVQLLWDLSGRFRVEEGHPFLEWLTAVPGFLVWVCIAYAALATVVGHLIGRPLIQKNYNKERTEADFRFGMARMREFSEQVALLRGEEAEKAALYAKYDRQVEATYSLVRTTRDLRIFSFSISQMTDVLPYVLVAPAYFAGVGSLGGLQQTAGAFSRVQSGFSIFLDLYETLALYKAAVNRINGFRRALVEARAIAGAQPIALGAAAGDAFTVADLTLRLPDGHAIARVPELSLARGESAIVTGPSGSGKSTLFRALAGIWPFGSGQVGAPRDESVMLLPQRAYLPLGTLRGALAYPARPDSVEGAEIEAAMRAVGLGHLVPRLDETALWSQALSGGEQQRVAVVRALLARPDWLFLDEATAALDEPMEEAVYRILRERLPGTTIVSIGHRSTLLAFHRRHLDMEPDAAGVFVPRDVPPDAAAAPA
ncbi:ABC transporter ATP-binding protein/permease [Amaricoccus sp.]|uniref:ABC transporter ATP-binding protein/permease n=1 Tax=Amaricoccus sp. TaxID=1872485 RepID=UPI001B71E606|nr:ABC transporter ATP-binding protein/permease [Amaricoccus sp.]MBP7000456.1 ABC transporter ATP-binding protein/permease [Amaricoccus sp.]